MKIIGITGLTGAGKGTVAKILCQHGGFHIDADLVARDVINNSEKVKAQLCREFGDEVVGSDGVLNRPALSKKAFASTQATEKLNAITHPAVTEKVKQIIDEKSNLGYSCIVVDAIALFESGEDAFCDFTVTVTAPQDIRLQRIIARDGITMERALERINAQKGESFFTERADFVVKNYPPHSLEKELAPIISIVKNYEGDI